MTAITLYIIIVQWLLRSACYCKTLGIFNKNKRISSPIACITISFVLEFDYYFCEKHPCGGRKVYLKWNYHSRLIEDLPHIIYLMSKVADWINLCYFSIFKFNVLCWNAKQKHSQFPGKQHKIYLMLCTKSVMLKRLKIQIEKHWWKGSFSCDLNYRKLQLQCWGLNLNYRNI